MSGKCHTGAYAEMDVADVTVLSPGGSMNCMAYKGSGNVVLMRGPDAAEHLLRVVTKQDNDPHFQERVMRLMPEKAAVAMAAAHAGSGGGGQQSGGRNSTNADDAASSSTITASKRFTVVLLVTETPHNASLTAFRMVTQLLRAGVDQLILVRPPAPPGRAE